MNETVGTLSPRRKAIVLVSCCQSLLIVSMDATIVNVAVPAIRTDLGATTSQLQWVIDIYTLVLASLLMLSGAAGDRFGRRRVFQIGLAVFVAGSLLWGMALDGFRPDRWDITGALICLVGVAVIMYAPRPARGRCW